MKAHSNDFKSNLVALGREFDDKIIYGSTTLGQDDISNVRMYYDSDLLKSTMKTLTFTSFTLIEKDTVVNYQCGLKVGNSYEYMNYGNFIVDKIEEQKDSKSYLYTCYDKMLYTMKDYESLGLTYPVTIRNYIIALCNKLGISFKNASDTFVNYDKEITSELYLDSEGNSLGYTYRDVLDDLAEATASNIIINQDDELEIKYIDNTAPLGTIYGNTTQEGTPTPDSPQPINVVTGGNVIGVVGKNLFNYDDCSNRGISDDNGTISTINTRLWSDKIRVTPSQKYTFKTTAKSSNNENIIINRLIYYDNTGNFLRRDYTYTTLSLATFTIPSDTYYIVIDLRTQALTTTLTKNILEGNTQLELGNQATIYENYIGRDYEINLGKNLFDDSIKSNTWINTSGVIVSSTGSNLTKVNCKSGDVYSLSATYEEASGSATIVMAFYNSSGTLLNRYATSGTTTLTLTKVAPNNTAYMYAGHYIAEPLKIQLEKSNKPTSYSPYKTPIELNKIGTYQDTIFKSSGKNLFDIKSFLTSNNVTYTENSDGSLSFTTSGVLYSNPYVFSSNNIVVSISSIITNVTSTNFYIELLSSDNTRVARLSSTNTSAENINACKVRFNWSGNGNVTIKNTMLNEGTTALPYEPYGKDWYIKKEIGKVVLDGSESGWGMSVDGTKIAYYLSMNNLPSYNYKLIKYQKYCNNFTYENTAWRLATSPSLCENTNNGNLLIFRYDDMATATDWRNWLSTHNTIVYYVLNTPTYTKITDEELLGQLNALRMATSYGTDTNLLISGSNLPLTIDSTNFINDYIDEEYFNDKNVNIGKKYGPINSLVLSRTNDTDNIYLQDDSSVTANGLCELKIVDNEILSADNRDDYLEEIFNHINGLEYYTNDFQTKGILYYELADIYNVKIDQNYYKCLMLRDDIKRTTGLKEFIKTDEPETTITEYRYANKTDRKINQATLIVNKQEGYIEGLVSKTNTMEININNNYQELKGQFNDYVPQSQYATLETSVRTLQTDTYTKQEINTKLTDGSVTKVMTASGTYDINGMTYEKSNANTKTTINEVGVGVKKTDGTDDYILFAGYVDDNNTQFSDFKGQTLVASENMLVRHYLVVGSKSRMEDYENGTGMFFIGG